MKFPTYEKYLAEHQEKAEKGGAMAQKRVEAQASLDKLHAQYESVMAEAIINGKDATKTLDEIAEKIEKAKRESDRAALEYDVYNKVSRDVTVNKQDIIDAWNRELNPQYLQKELTPVLDHLEAMKKAYYEAMCVYFDKLHAIEDFREEVSGQLGYDYPHFFHIHKLETTRDVDRYFIRQDDMDRAQSRNRG